MSTILDFSALGCPRGKAGRGIGDGVGEERERKKKKKRKKKIEERVQATTTEDGND